MRQPPVSCRPDPPGGGPWGGATTWQTWVPCTSGALEPRESGPWIVQSPDPEAQAHCWIRCRADPVRCKYRGAIRRPSPQLRPYLPQPTSPAPSPAISPVPQFPAIPSPTPGSTGGRTLSAAVTEADPGDPVPRPPLSQMGCKADDGRCSQRGRLWGPSPQPNPTPPAPPPAHGLTLSIPSPLPWIHPRPGSRQVQSQRQTLGKQPPPPAPGPPCSSPPPQAPTPLDPPERTAGGAVTGADSGAPAPNPTLPFPALSPSTPALSSAPPLDPLDAGTAGGAVTGARR